MRVTLADIAAHAGVSEATVSRVINNKPRVAERTRRSVQEAIEELGHVPTPSRTRRSRRTLGVVGLVLPELENPIFPHFAHVMGTMLARHNYTPMVCSHTFGGVHEDEYVAMLLDQGAKGIVFVCGIHSVSDTEPGRYQDLRRRGLPVVLVNGYLPQVDAHFVSTDDAAAVRMAAGHLEQLGHRRIGLATGEPRYVHVQRRIAAFVDLARETGRDPGLVHSSFFTPEGGAAAARVLLSRGATAIVASSDVMALGAIRAVRELGLRVPEDVSVVGYDDSPMMEFTDPPLTTVRQPVGALSQAAVRGLLAGFAGADPPEVEFLFRPELVVRASTSRATGVPSDVGRRHTVRTG